jgi:nucleoside-diphosphate-sugar epimerase/rhodanese-related sulfurtransferase
MLGSASYYDFRNMDSANVSIVDVRELRDNQGNSTRLVMEKIQAALKSLEQGRRVVVCCDKGISRSNAVALGVLLGRGMRYEEAVGLVVEKVGPHIDLGLLHDIRSLFHDDEKPSDQEAVANILVTGSTGFIGRPLVNALMPEHKVLGVGRDLDLVHGLPLLDLYIKKNHVGLIVHLAHPRMRNSVSSMGEAIAMMKNILEVCRLNDLGLLYLSGLVVFSGYTSPSLLVARSSLQPRPKGTYGETKFLCEELVRMYQEANGLESAVLRPAAVYGEDMEESTIFSKFFEAAKHGHTIYTHRYRNGPPTFDFLYIGDLIEAIRLTLQSRPRAVLNLGTGRATSTYELARLITRITSSDSRVEMIDIDEDTYHVIVDPSEAKRDIRWEARTDLETGLNEMWEKIQHSVPTGVN